jgi:putative ABC transport system ATP-binding protein
MSRRSRSTETRAARCVELLHGLAKKQSCAILMVTHDNRILDIADRILSLEDGRLNSFASALTASTGRAIEVFARLQHKGGLLEYITGLSSGQFREVLAGMTSELEQFFTGLRVG